MSLSIKDHLYILIPGLLIGIGCAQEEPASSSLELTDQRSSLKLSSNTGIFHKKSPKPHDSLHSPHTDEHKRSTYIFESAEQGDLACYVTLLNTSTQKLEHYDSEFEWCHRPKLIGQTIKATFQQITVNDCESIEPCGQSGTTVSLRSAHIVEDRSQ